MDIRLSDSDEEILQEIVKRSTKWNRSDAMRFCLNFAHFMLSTMPAETIDAVISDQIKSDDDE